MRINSSESARRAMAAYARYGSWDAVMKASTIGRDARVAKTPLRVTTRPEIDLDANEICLKVEPFTDPARNGFFYHSRNSGTVNRESFDSRGHLLIEQVVKKGSFLKSEVVKYQLLLRATKRARSLAAEVQHLWDKYAERIASGELEMLIYLPTYGEGEGKKGSSRGRVEMRPRQK